MLRTGACLHRVLLGVVLVGCTNRIDGVLGTLPPDPTNSDPNNPSDPPGSPNNPNTPIDPEMPIDADPLPPGIQRLSNREYLGAVASLFPEVAVDGEGLPPDTRQSDFTRNQAQIVDPVLGRSFQTIAFEVAAAMTTAHRSRFPACMAESPPSDGCVQPVLAELAAQAFRRPLEPGEAEALLAVFQVGVAERDGWYGLQLALAAILQAPSFLYQRQLGAVLDGRELAESLAFLLTGRPPDAALLQAADAGTLAAPDERERQVRRLYALPDSRAHLAATLLEWLRIDRLNDLAKDANVYPDFFAQRPEMWEEAVVFSTASLAEEVDSLQHLLTEEHADARKGLLSSRAFLSVYASPTESSPVKRGNAILKKLLCVELQIPDQLMINIVPPEPYPSLTTRERYSQHSSDMACSNCHQHIDPLGFAFEAYDGMGTRRETENGKPIDTRVHVVSEGAQGDFAGSDQLIDRLAASAEVRDCFARNVFRFALGRTAWNLENQLIGDWKRRTESASVLELLVTYARSEDFAQREVE
jgi:hypothetical protein